MDFMGDQRGLWVVVLLVFCVPSEGEVAKPDVLFPPGRPMAPTLWLICDYRSLRPAYKLSTFPTGAYSYLYRQASAVNRIEIGYIDCCKTSWTDVAGSLRCAMRVWDSELTTFCEEESMVKTKMYHCCEDADMLGCFERAAPNPLYKYPPPKK